MQCPEQRCPESAAIITTHAAGAPDAGSRAGLRSGYCTGRRSLDDFVIASPPSTAISSAVDRALRICLIGKYPPIQGGISAQCYWMCRWLAERGHEIDVVRMPTKSRIDIAFVLAGRRREPGLGAWRPESVAYRNATRVTIGSRGSPIPYPWAATLRCSSTIATIFAASRP
jgi:hypothetical protein